MPTSRLYVHVPFCLTRCTYCDFYSTTDEGFVDRYVDALLHEAALARDDGVGSLETLYLGGGTPSRLDERRIERLIGGVLESLPPRADCEITLEANPDDVTPGRVASWVRCGVGRVSLGVQSFHDGELRALERRHDAATARSAYRRVRDGGVEDVSVDLIFALPGQSLGGWKRNLDAASALEPDHLSCYQLTLEPRTVLARRMAATGQAPADEETCRAMFLETHERLGREGFEHYEISSWARPRRRSRHNGAYWTHEAYRGLGPSAHSFDGGWERWWNVASLRTYLEALERGEAPVEDRERLDAEQRLLEELMLGFRTVDGVAMTVIERIPAGERVVTSLVEEGLVQVDEGRVAPTISGMLVADSLPSRFW